MPVVIDTLQCLESKPHQSAQLVFMRDELEFGLFVFVRKENRRTRKKPSEQGGNQQQTQTTCDAGLEWMLGYIDGWEGGERSRHHAIHAPLNKYVI